MSTSTNLSLPFLQEAQAQKHVTVNEALLALDEVVQLSVESRGLAVPPGAPSEGERHIVPSGASGAWTGWTGHVAVYRDGVWQRRVPHTGWLAYIADEAALVVFDGSDWQGIGAPGGTTSLLGVNATADTTNRLTVSSDAVLFNHAGGDSQMKINKNTVTDTASLVFQTGFSGRAEFGLVGSDTFAVKVSADGIQFVEGFKVESSGAFTVGSALRVWHGLGADTSSVALGMDAADAVTTGVENTALGAQTATALTSGDGNTFVGNAAGSSVTTGDDNVSVGRLAGRDNVSGVDNVFVGSGAGLVSLGDQCTAVGKDALATSGTAVTNATAVGFDAQVTGSDQLQLGNSATTVYAYGAVQNRSDGRDKTDVRDTGLGLEFIEALRPVDFRWDFRDDYDRADGAAPKSLARTRFHHGFIAQDVADLIARSGVDFGGFQEHSRNGGADVQSLGYTEFVAPLVRAVQELSARVRELEGRSD